MMIPRTPHSWDGTAARRNRITFYVLILTITIILVLKVGAQTYILSLGGEIQQVRKEKQDIGEEIKDLERQVAELNKGSRIKMIAQDRLGMIIPVGAPRKLF